MFLSDWEFKRNLAKYSEVVDYARSGIVPRDSTIVGIEPKKNLPHVNMINASCCKDGTLVVEFHINSSVLMLHTGYLYKGYEGRNDCVNEDMRPEQNWYYLRHVVGNWYHFADQPGL